MLSSKWKYKVLNRFPVKHLWDLLSLLQIFIRGYVSKNKPLNFEQKINCINFYIRANNIKRLYAAPARAGSRWTQLGIALALDLASGGDGEYTYHPATDNFYPTQGQIWKRLDWRVPTGEWDRNHAKPDLSGIGKQEFFLFHQPYFQSRTWAIKDFKTVIVTRSILACLESRYIKLSHAPYIEKIFLNDSNTFDWDGELKNIISFYNSWGDVMRWHPNIRHFKFEDLKKNTVKNFSDLLNFWGYDISDQYIEEGFRRVTKYEMLARMGTDKTNQRITTLSKNERGIIPADVFRRAIEVLNRDLVYDFGYSYTPDSQYVQDLK